MPWDMVMDAHSLNPSGPFTPAPTTAAFRDLLIFEERLKQNAARMQERKVKYQSTSPIITKPFLLCYVFSSCGWDIAFYPVTLKCVVPSDMQHVLVRYLRIGLLSIGCMMLFLFFASGLFADKITAAHKYVPIRLLTRFVPQANRSLQTFNLHLNMRKISRKPAWLSWLPIWRDATATQSTGPYKNPTWYQREPRNAFPRNERRTFQISNPQNLPPARNERGEIVLSSRVNTEFREGYERYRNAFERKRREKMEAQRRTQPGYFSSLWPFYRGPASTNTDSKAPRTKTS